MKTTYINCDCNSTEHHFVLNIDKDMKEAYISMYLINTDSFWTRLLKAFNYLFCLPTYPYGHYDEILLNQDKLRELHTCLEEVV